MSGGIKIWFESTVISVEKKKPPHVLFWICSSLKKQIIIFSYLTLLRAFLTWNTWMWRGLDIKERIIWRHWRIYDTLCCSLSALVLMLRSGSQWGGSSSYSRGCSLWRVRSQAWSRNLGVSHTVWRCSGSEKWKRTSWQVRITWTKTDAEVACMGFISLLPAETELEFFCVSNTSSKLAVYSVKW